MCEKSLEVQPTQLDGEEICKTVRTKVKVHHAAALWSLSSTSIVARHRVNQINGLLTWWRRCFLSGGVVTAHEFAIGLLLFHTSVYYTGPQCMRHDWLRSSSMCLSVGWHTLQVRSSVAERVEGEYLICSYNLKKIVQKCVATGECSTTV